MLGELVKQTALNCFHPRQQVVVLRGGLILGENYGNSLGIELRSSSAAYHLQNVTASMVNGRVMK